METRTRKALMRAGIHMALAVSEVLKAVQVIITELAHSDADQPHQGERERAVQRINVDE